MPLPLSLLGCAGALIGFAAFVYLATHNDYRWVELEDNTLRAKHLYTGRTIERSVDEIDNLGIMVYQVRRLEIILLEKMLGRVKGIETRFRDGRTPLRILRADPAMTNAKELIEAVLYRMMQIRELDANIINFHGQPLVRNIHWKGQQPRVPGGKSLKLILAGLIGLGLLFAPILCFWGLQEQERQALAAVPPHEIALSSLIRNGRGTNRHVIITDFRPGGYRFEAKHGALRNVWIALFPTGVQTNEIKVVLSSTAVRDEADLRQLLLHGRVTGICSEAPRSSWGTTLGPELEKLNPGCTLSSAWEIKELNEPPSAALVNGSFSASAGCFALAILFAMIVFWKSA
jgi:hypothetical protein